MDLDLYNFSFGTHRDKNVIWIRFEKNTTLIQELRKTFPSAKWSNTKRAWHLPDLPAVRDALKLARKEWGSKIKSEIDPVNQKAFSDFIDHLKLKAYSKNTIRTYVTEFGHLLKLIETYPVDDLSENRLKDYFLYNHKRLQNQSKKPLGFCKNKLGFDSVILVHYSDFLQDEILNIIILMRKINIHFRNLKNVKLKIKKHSGIRKYCKL